MRCTIDNDKKRESILAILQLLKQSTQMVHLDCRSDHIYLQGMDRSHVCLYDIRLHADWFTSYECPTTHLLCVNIATLVSILASATPSHQVVWHSGMEDDEPDKFHIDLLVKPDAKVKEFSHHYSIPLMEEETEYLQVTEMDYEAEWTVATKKVADVLGSMVHFGDTLQMQCSESYVKWKTHGPQGDMEVDIPTDDLEEYSLVESEGTLSVTYNIAYVHRMCVQTKIATLVSLSLCRNAPLRTRYDLGDQSHVVLYLAPKVDDDDNEVA